MRISVASGKGGTGKTTVAVNLATVLGKRAQYLDCDVEEPNGHLFLNPEITSVNDVEVPVPEIDLSKCDFCRKCQEVCMFNAILVIPGSKVMTFPELCHSCGACAMFCPRNAITEVNRMIGKTESGMSGDLSFVHGVLNIGEPMAPPVIKAVLDRVDESRTAIIDSSPGTSCPVVEAVSGSDYCLLVGEPTPFGLNDLRLAVKMLGEIGLPCGIVINRSDSGDEGLERYCEEQQLEVLARIPHDMEIARAYSRGELIIDALPRYRKLFEELAEGVRTRAGRSILK